MLIYLNKSKLFTEDPAIRFSRERNLSPDVWNALWKRHTLLGYPTQGLCEYFELKTGTKMLEKIMERWMIRGEVYYKARPLMAKWLEVVTTEFFDEFETDIIEELTRNLRYGNAKSSKSIV
jgi:hypothetical protein